MQTHWVNLILSHFDKSQRFILVADPDGVLQEESVLTALGQRGYEITEYEDPIVARYLYEKEWRFRLRSGEKLLLRSSEVSTQVFPHDWLSQAQTVSLRLADLCPHLSYPVLRRLPRSYLPALVAPMKRLRRSLGDQETRRFVLKYALEFTPEAIVSMAGLIHHFILLYVRHPSIPQELLDTAASDLLWLADSADVFAGKVPFFMYLQREWERYVQSEASSIPFEDMAVRYLMPSLFAEGFLRRPPVSQANPPWVSIGVVSPARSAAEQLLLHLEDIAPQIPTQNARHTQWQAFAIRWGEVTAQVMGLPPSVEIDQRFFSLREIIDTYFWNWLVQHYSLLLSLSPLPTPVTVHKVVPYLSAQSAPKRALLVLDGLSMVVWWLIREKWLKHHLGFEWTESAVFAMIPTITSISRQSLFAGKLPSAFPKHLNSTSHEPNHWQRFWGDGQQIAYDKGKLNEVLQRLDETTRNRTVPIVGFVINDIDDIADVSVQGFRGLAASLKQWVETEPLETLIHELLRADYLVVLTSDHGHTAAKGIGTLKEGLAVEHTCRRARWYASEALRPAHPNARPWPGYGLPKELFPLLSAGYTAFVKEGEDVVTHGGASIEEVLVPLIGCQRKKPAA